MISLKKIQDWIKSKKPQFELLEVIIQPNYANVVFYVNRLSDWERFYMDEAVLVKSINKPGIIKSFGHDCIHIGVVFEEGSCENDVFEINDLEAII